MSETRPSLGEKLVELVVIRTRAPGSWVRGAKEFPRPPVGLGRATDLDGVGMVSTFILPSSEPLLYRSAHVIAFESVASRAGVRRMPSSSL